MAGRRPTPTATKLLNGNPGHRALNKSEPKFTGTPTCPKHLDKEAKTEWKRVSAELIAAGLLTTVDRAALAAYCSAWSRWLNAELSIQKFGTVIKSPKSGFPIQNPFVGVANTALEQMRRWAVEFGMTPSSRSRISTTPSGGNGGNENAFENFMRGIGAMDEPEDTNEDIESEQLRDTSDTLCP
jgi:P27 family predicted phage terminase small subunit